MNLKSVYSKADLRRLVVVLESQHDYTSECVRIVKKEFENRKSLPDSVKSIAEEEYHLKIQKILKEFDPLSDSFNVPSSYFLDNNNALDIAKYEFNRWLDQRKSLGFDVLKYSLGMF